MVQKTYKQFQSSVTCAARHCAEYTYALSRFVLLRLAIYRQHARKRVLKFQQAAQQYVLRVRFILDRQGYYLHPITVSVHDTMYWLHGSDPFDM